MIVGIDVDFSRMIAVRARWSLGKVRFTRHRVYLLSRWRGVYPLLKNYTTNSDDFHNFVEQSMLLKGGGISWKKKRR